MSLCVCLQYKDELIVGADTAVTEMLQGEKYRRKEGIEKLVKVDNFLIFLCGDVGLCLQVIRYFKQEESRTIKKLQQIIIDCYQQFIAIKPEALEKSTSENGSVLNIAVFEACKNGHVASYAFNPGNGFAIDRTEVSKNQIKITTGGILSDKACEMTVNLMNSGIKQADTVIRQVFENLSGDSIGGNLTYYIVDRRGVRLLRKEKIRETIRIKKLDDHFWYVLDDHFRVNIIRPLHGAQLQGGTITGSLIQTAVAGIYPRIEFSITDNLLIASLDADTSIAIDPDVTGSPGFVFTAPGLSALLSIALTTILFNNFSGPISLTGSSVDLNRDGGSTRIANWSSFINYDTSQTLQQALDNLQSQISSNSARITALGG